MNKHNQLLPQSSEMHEADRLTLEQGCISSYELMKRASESLTKEILKQLPPSDIFILCGPGNNGGDGMCIARLLHERDFRVRVCRVGGGKFSQDNQLAFADLPHSVLLDCKQFAFALKENPNSVLLDALLGTGQKNAPHGDLAEVMLLVKDHRFVWGIDTPSGINVDTGEVFEPHMICEKTFTVEAIKRGMTQYPAREFVGEIFIAPAGIKLTESEFSILTPSSIKQKTADSHKGDAGPVLFIAGSKLMPGALQFATEGAIAGGASLISAFNFNKSISDSVIRIDSQDEEVISDVHLPVITQHIKKSRSFVLGPGLGQSERTRHVVIELLVNNSFLIPGVIDADGLNLCVHNPRALKGRVITPHPGEAARLLGISTSEVQRDRFYASKTLAKKTEAVVVLKGAGTIVYDNDSSRGYVCLEGGPSLGIGGSGDVLAGVLGALLARGLSNLDAAKTAVYYHALVGSNPEVTFKTPTEIANAIFKLMYGN